MNAEKSQEVKPERLGLAFFVAFALPEGGEVLGGGGLFGGGERGGHGKGEFGGKGGWMGSEKGFHTMESGFGGSQSPVSPVTNFISQT